MTSLTNKEKLQRVLYYNNADSFFQVGNIDDHTRICKRTFELLTEYSNKPEDLTNEFLNAVKMASKDENLPERSVLFITLRKMLLFENMNPPEKHKVTEALLEICQSDEDFFNFVRYHAQFREKKSSLSTGVIKAVRRYYNKKTPLELAQSYAKFNKLYSWTHKDLVKLAHVKSDSPEKNIAINYILSKKVPESEPEGTKTIIDVMKKSDQLRSTKDAEEAVKIIDELKLNITQVFPALLMSDKVWKAALKNMTIQEILPWLGKLYKLGFLKPKNTVHDHLQALFSNSEKVGGSKVHPIEIFTYWKRLEKGGKVMDPNLVEHLKNDKQLAEDELKKAQTRTEAKCTTILKALQKCFEIACDSLPPIKKRFLVTIDVTEKALNANAVGCKPLNGLEASTAYAFILLKAGVDAVIASFENEKISIIKVDKKISYSDLVDKIKSRKSSYCIPTASIDWALSQKKKFDVFVNIVNQNSVMSTPKDVKEKHTISLVETMEKYRKDIDIPNAKLVSVFVAPPRLPSYFIENGYEHKNVLDVFGLNDSACKLIQAFIKDTVH